MKHIFKLLFLITLFSCSSQEKIAAPTEFTPIGDGLLLGESDEEGVVELVIPEVEEYRQVKEQVETTAKLERLELGSNEPAEDTANNIQAAPIASVLKEELTPEPKVAKVSTPVKRAPSSGEEERFEEYTVQKRDSLMLIGYKLYRNFNTWKDIVSWNEDQFRDQKRIYVGQKLKVRITDTYGRVWRPEGTPYLVKKGEFLGKISMKVYNTTRLWKEIWVNNSILIKDPDKVYAGFTIYIPSVKKILAKDYKDKKFKEYIQTRLPASAGE